MKALIKSKLTAGILTAILASFFFSIDIGASEQLPTKHKFNKNQKCKINSEAKKKAQNLFNFRRQGQQLDEILPSVAQETPPPKRQDGRRDEQISKLNKEKSKKVEEIKEQKEKINNLSKTPEMSNGEFYRSRRQELLTLSKLKSQLCDIEMEIKSMNNEQ